MSQEIEITDVHLSLSDETSVLFPGQIVAGPENALLIGELRELIKNAGSGDVVVQENGDRWRTEEMRPGRFALRKLRPAPRRIDQLGLPKWVATKLVEKGSASGGLIMILGPTGAGKTTTFSATIVGRLTIHGGYALTIEDPPEDVLEGAHGTNGYCEQLNAKTLGGYEKAMHTALRCFPARENAMLGYGEVRENSTAANLLRAALDGHWVIFTAHANSISAGISRLISMAETGGESNAVELFNNSFYLAVHQKFNDRKELVVSAISPDMCRPITNYIANRNFTAIETEVKRINSNK